MASMSPPAGGAGSPPAPAFERPKRGRGSRGGRMGPAPGSGRGGRGGARKKRDSTIASVNNDSSHGNSGQTSAANTPVQREIREGSMLSRRSAGNRQTAGAATTANNDEDDEDEDADGEGDDELDLLLGDDEYDEQAKERSEAKEALRLLLDQFTPEQFERYEVYRAAGFQKAAVRRLVNHVLQQTCSPNIVIGVKGLAKVFVGEIVESARQVQADAGREGPVHPDDLREAYRRYQTVANKKGSQRAKLFVR